MFHVSDSGVHDWPYTISGAYPKVLNLCTVIGLAPTEMNLVPMGTAFTKLITRTSCVLSEKQIFFVFKEVCTKPLACILSIVSSMSLNIFIFKGAIQLLRVKYYPRFKPA